MPFLGRAHRVPARPKRLPRKLSQRVSCILMRESTEEQAAVRGPYESFRDFRKPFIVDLEPSVVHNP